VLRQWIDTKGPTFRGTDYNRKLVNWSKKNLPFDIKHNRLEPPLDYADGTFDLCYAISVFTHLPEELQEPWLNELCRILRPNGILLVTLSGEGDLVRTTPAEQQSFHNRGLVVLDRSYAGTNLCGVYHSEAYVRKTWSRHFEVVRFIPEGAKGSPRQDLYVLRR
jgi:SAM-dependent methyltransferase